MEQIFIGFGSNLGDSEQICSQAIGLLERSPGITVRRISSFYRTEPVGVAEQAWFLNGALLCETTLEPEELLEIILDVENRFGRVRSTRWGPRTLDLDILFFGNRRIDLPRLTVPHPRIHERRFVLAPMAEIAPDWVHPILALTMEDMLARLPSSGQKIERLAKES